MDVVESGTAYVITVELPGVTADGIHVEVLRGRYESIAAWTVSGVCYQITDDV
jgi:HSP20 family molecular chaperone IbpA